MTVEIVASGHVETPADRFRVTGSALACAATQAEADALLAQKVAAIARSMAAIGVEKSVAQDKPSIAGMMGSMMGARGAGACNGADAAFLDDAKAMDKPATPVAASTRLSFDARDRATAAGAIAALKAADAKPSDKVLPVLLNDTEARRAAKQMALRTARIEADAYAALLGLKGATLTKISELGLARFHHPDGEDAGNFGCGRNGQGRDGRDADRRVRTGAIEVWKGTTVSPYESRSGRYALRSDRSRPYSGIVLFRDRTFVRNSGLKGFGRIPTIRLMRFLALVRLGNIISGRAAA